MISMVINSVADPDPDPHHLAGSDILDADPDPADPDLRLKNWHLINVFSVEKYCE
jgi:hypothetical protein